MRRKVTVSVSFLDSTIFDIEEIEVEEGIVFCLHVHNFKGEDIHWMSDNDPVLDILVSDHGRLAKIVASNTGSSTIELDGIGKHFRKHIKVKVRDGKAVSYRVIGTVV